MIASRFLLECLPSAATRVWERTSAAKRHARWPLLALVILSLSGTCGWAAVPQQPQRVTTPKEVLWEPNNGGTASAFLGDFQSVFAIPNTGWPTAAKGSKYLMLRSTTVARQGQTWVKQKLAPFMAAEHLQLVLDTSASDGWSCIAAKSSAYKNELSAIEWSEAAGITVAYVNFQNTMSDLSLPCSRYTVQMRANDIVAVAHKYQTDLKAAGYSTPKFMQTESSLSLDAATFAKKWGSDSSCTPAATGERYTGCQTISDFVNATLYYLTHASPAIVLTAYKIDVGAERICGVMSPGKPSACPNLSPPADVTDADFQQFTNFLYGKGLTPWLDISVNHATTYADVTTRGQAVAKWVTGLSGHAVRSVALVLFAPLTGGGADMPAYLDEKATSTETHLLEAITQTMAAWTPR